MYKLIYLEDAINLLTRRHCDICPYNDHRHNSQRCNECDYKEAMDDLEDVPTIEERKKGKWSFIGDNMFECTCCGTPYTTQQLNGLRNYNTDPYAPKFCPNCGADMRGDEHEND